jgi:hypothetical protein
MSQGDYIVKLNKDTLFVNVVRMDKKMKNVVCETNGRKIKYEAKDVLVLKNDTVFYEVGEVRLKRNKEFVFLKKVIAGKLNLYEIGTRRTKMLWKNFGEDLVHFRWVYRAQAWSKKVSESVFFYKKEGEFQKDFTRNWKEKIKGCKLIEDKIRSEIWNPGPVDLVKFYNASCD